MGILKNLKIKLKKRVYWITLANTPLITGFRPFSNQPNSKHWILIYGSVIMLLVVFLIPIKPKKISNSFLI